MCSSRYLILTCTPELQGFLLNVVLSLFCRIKKLLTEKKAKSERENGLIYHQKQPEVRRNSQNISGLLTKPEVKIMTHWPLDFFPVFVIRYGVVVCKLAEKARSQHHVEEQGRYCLWHTEHRFSAGSTGNAVQARKPYLTHSGSPIIAQGLVNLSPSRKAIYILYICEKIFTALLAWS